MKINISQVDTLFANGNYPIEFLIYYKNKLNSKKIQKALKKLSSTFWPVFGEYSNGVISSCKYKVNNYFDEIESEKEFKPFDPAEDIYNEYCNAIPADINRLFFLKIIQVKNGTILIPKMNHIAGDGYSYFYFLSVLALMSQTSFVPFKKSLIRRAAKPHHNRTILKDFSFGLKGFDLLPPQKSLTIKFEEIPRADIRDMIKDVSNNMNQSNSENDILSAMVVKKLIDAQKDCKADKFKLTIPIDVRRKIKEYGSKFLGNGLQFGEIDFSISEIKKQNIGEIAVKIRRSMPQIVKERYIKYLEKLEDIISNNQTNKLKPFDPETGCLVTNLSKLPSGKLNFGSGAADFIAPLTIEKNSAAVLADKDNFILRLSY
jgi:transferase family protein